MAGKKVLDPKTLRDIEGLASIHATEEEAAAVLDIALSTFKNWLKRKDVSRAWDGGKAKGRATLRRLQVQEAMKGNITMLIWLGKQLLGQRDITRNEVTGAGGQSLGLDLGADTLATLAREFIASREGRET